MAPIVGFIGNLGEHAADYASHGLEVFPVRPRGSLAKTPYHSQYQATTDETQIRAWWDEHPNALIGHRFPAEHISLDVDPRHGGLDVFAALQAEVGGHWPMTRCHLSGRGDGGGHTWWQRPAEKLTVTKLDRWAEERGLGHEIVYKDGPKAGQRARWTSGIDVLHRKHRYTILPPSPHPDTGKPYRWAGSNGLHVPIAPLPQLLVDLLTNDTPPEPPQPPRRPRDGDSIADWYSSYHRWADLLGRHGWVLVGGDGNSDGSRWRHPAATNAFSATIRHGCLFVYSTSTIFEVTNPSDPHGYTVFAAWALLEHAGDQRAAASAARALKDGSRPPRAAPTIHLVNEPPPYDAPPPEEPPDERALLSDEFWNARPYLAHIRQAAHARQRSAPAVLHVVLARVSAIAPHTCLLPAIVGAPAPLCYFAAVIAPAGLGKSTANRIAAELVPAPEWVADQLPLGSGEGIVELLFDTLDEKNPQTGKTEKVKKQTRHNVFLYSDEGQVLGEIGNRRGSTLLPTIRSIWTGDTLGQANANRERYRVAPALSYTYGLVVGFQSAKAGALLEDADGGTPQRFGWAPALDPTVPDLLPDWPGPLAWQPPPKVVAGNPIALAPEIADEVRSADRAQVRGETEVDALDTHARLYRLKVAALLAILDSRRNVDLDDWTLAAVIQDASNVIRSGVISNVAYEAHRREQAATRTHANREVAAEVAKEQRRIVDCARKVAAKVHREPERRTVAELRRDMRRYRDVFDDALDHAITEDWIVEHPEPGQGADKRCLRPGGTRP